MRRGLFSENKKKMLVSVTNEHELFRYKTLSGSREAIYEECTKIKFVECLYEYFMYREEISPAYVDAVLKIQGHIFTELYRIYLENEYIRADTFEDIEELLNILIRTQEEY